MNEYKEVKGRWVTVDGKHIFIRDGETPSQAFNRTFGIKDSPIRKSVDEKLLHNFVSWVKKEEQQRNRAYHNDDVIKVDGKWVKNTSKESQELYRQWKELSSTGAFSSNVRKDYEKATGNKLTDAEWKVLSIAMSKQR